MNEFQLNKKLELLDDAHVRSILEDFMIHEKARNAMRDHYKTKIFELRMQKAKSSKWKQLDLEEAIENEKQETCACGKNKTCQCD